MDGRLKGIKILLADDAYINYRVARNIIRAHGGELVHAANGLEAVECFQASKLWEFNAVLMDICMPVMDGWTAAEKIRELDRADARAVPIIALSSQHGEDDIRRCFRCGMNHYMRKPYDAEELVETICGFLKI